MENTFLPGCLTRLVEVTRFEDRLRRVGIRNRAWILGLHRQPLKDVPEFTEVRINNRTYIQALVPLAIARGDAAYLEGYLRQRPRL
jgi:hypothetical protein